MEYPKNIQNLIHKLSRLPTIGPKTAERMALYLLSKNEKELDQLSEAILEIKGKIKKCEQCQNFSEKTVCLICSDQKRDASLLCIVAKPQDVIALEKTKTFHGVYHILGGTVNPIEGTRLKDLQAPHLFERLKKQKVKEIILAFNPDIEGETTILALLKELRPLHIKLTRLARGLPMGSDIEYADEITLSDALQGRKTL